MPDEIEIPELVLLELTTCTTSGSAEVRTLWRATASLAPDPWQRRDLLVRLIPLAHMLGLTPQGLLVRARQGRPLAPEIAHAALGMVELGGFGDTQKVDRKEAERAAAEAWAKNVQISGGPFVPSEAAIYLSMTHEALTLTAGELHAIERAARAPVQLSDQDRHTLLELVYRAWPRTAEAIRQHMHEALDASERERSSATALRFADRLQAPGAHPKAETCTWCGAECAASADASCAPRCSGCPRHVG